MRKTENSCGNRRRIPVSGKYLPYPRSPGSMLSVTELYQYPSTSSIAILSHAKRHSGFPFTVLISFKTSSKEQPCFLHDASIPDSSLYTASRSSFPRESCAGFGLQEIT